MYNNAYAELNITKAAYETIAAIEKELSDAFSAIEENESINEAKVLAAFIGIRLLRTILIPLPVMDMMI